jgi:hypothetical protein
VSHHAMARSAVLASHSNSGLTTPGLINVPTPGYPNKGQDGLETQSGTRRLNLVIHNLIKRAAFIEESVELDDVRILNQKSDRLVRCSEEDDVETDRRAVLIGSAVETKHNHSRLAYGGIGRHGGWFRRERRRRSNLWATLHPTIGEIKELWRSIGTQWIRIDSIWRYGAPRAYSTFPAAELAAAVAVGVTREETARKALLGRHPHAVIRNWPKTPSQPRLSVDS